MKNYSSGMYVRLGFSVAINVDPDVLLVDEVLAVGDEQFQRRCNEQASPTCEPQGKTIVLVSHSPGRRCGRCATRSRGSTRAVLRAIGPAGDVIDQYLAEVHEERQRGGARHRVPVGIGEVRLERIEVLDREGRATDDVRTGEAVTFRLPLRRRGAHRAPHLLGGAAHARGRAAHQPEHAARRG